MQANWSLILNILLLTGVVVAIIRMLRTKKMAESSTRFQPSMGGLQGADKVSDDVIAVRKVMRESSPPSIHANISSQVSTQRPVIHSNQNQLGQRTTPQSIKNMTPSLSQEMLNGHKPNVGVRATAVHEESTSLKSNEIASQIKVEDNTPAKQQDSVSQTLVIFLLAKANRQLAGYELLQTILAAGLRFGEGHLFHRHQYPNGQGPVLCSLATATASGVFDLQNIGAFSVHGLCLFMQTSGNPTIDLERLSIMVDTAKQLSEGLDTHLLDEKRNPWSDATEVRYESMLRSESTEVAEEAI